ncbi:MAG: hydroxymethylglutaryl-CoA lyase [Vulcanimicrobiota bacterium]
MSRRVKVVEVGPRDGLQNEKQPLSTDFKLELIQRLDRCGFPEIEVTSMVHPRWVPQLADAAELLARLPEGRAVQTVLVPNLKGLERALACGARRVAVFIAASETFSQKNTNRSIETSLQETEEVVGRALQAGLSVRGYLSTVFVCPFEGRIPPATSAELTRKLLVMGCDEVSLGDTIGAAVPEDVDAVLTELEGVAPEQLALHLHDTYGTALANVTRGLDRGIRSFDSSVGGAGGCPYAPGATGNLATEDLLYLLERGGWEHGIEQAEVLETARFLEQGLGRPGSSHLLAVNRL